MNNSLATIDPTFIALMHGSFRKDSALQPFAREILLVECHVSGTLGDELRGVEAGLLPGTMLTLQREPANAHDKLAIRVYDTVGHALGYVPRITNAPLARLMDAGKQLLARIETKEWRGDWLRIDISVYMREF